MTDIIKFFALLATIVISWSFLYFLTKRLACFSMIRALKKIEGVRVKVICRRAVFCPNVSTRPFAEVTVGEKIYLLRLFSGGGGSRSVHIANGEYAAVFYKSGGGGVRHIGGRGRRIRRVSEPFRTSFAVTKIIPKLDTGMEKTETAQEDYFFNFGNEGKRVKTVPVLLFCPEPKELTFVTPEKNSIKAAFSGDKVFENRVFTPNTFLKYIDRDARGFYD